MVVRQGSKSTIQRAEEAQGMEGAGLSGAGTLGDRRSELGSERWEISGSMLATTDAAQRLNSETERARPLHTGTGRITNKNTL